MGIENYHLHHRPENPAYLALIMLQEWCRVNGLSPKTVKPIEDLAEVEEKTAFGNLSGRNLSNPSSLTPQEERLIAEKEISKVPKILITDIDGVLVSIWPPLEKFFANLSSSESWQDRLNEAIQSTTCWTTLLPLARLARLSDRVIFWTNRILVDRGVVDGGGWAPWKNSFFF